MTEPSPLDRLYQTLADAHELEGGLEQQRQELRDHVTQREQQLQQARGVAEAAGDIAQTKRITLELEELRRAWSTLTDDEDTGAQDQQSDAHGIGDQRRGDRHQGDARD